MVKHITSGFGGCCTNVFVLENLLSNNDSEYSLGTLITFCQFLTTTILSIPINSKGFIKPKVPIEKWFYQLHYISSLHY